MYITLFMIIRWKGNLYNDNICVNLVPPEISKKAIIKCFPELRFTVMEMWIYSPTWHYDYIQMYFIFHYFNQCLFKEIKKEMYKFILICLVDLLTCVCYTIIPARFSPRWISNLLPCLKVLVSCRRETNIHVQCI